MREYCDEHVVVFPVKFVDGEMLVQASRAATAADNAIAVRFLGDPHPKCFLLFHTIPADAVGEEPDGYHVELFFPVTERDEIDPRTWKQWVQGSRREVIMERLSRLETDLLIAAGAGAQFVTSLPASRDLAGLSLAPQEEGGPDPISALLRLDLPFFDNVQVADIARARADEETFEDFRIAMDKAFRGIDTLPDSQEFQKQVDQISRDLLTRPIQRIERRMKAIKRNMLFEAAILTMGCLSSTIITQGSTLAGAALASVLGLELFKKAMAADDELRQLPSFFYWELTKARRHPGGGRGV